MYKMKIIRIFTSATEYFITMVAHFPHCTRLWNVSGKRCDVNIPQAQRPYVCTNSMSSSLEIHACGDISEKLCYVASRIFHNIFKVKFLMTGTKGVFSFLLYRTWIWLFYKYVGVVRITVQKNVVQRSVVFENNIQPTLNPILNLTDNVRAKVR